MRSDRNRGFWDVWFQKYVIDPQIAYQNEPFYHVLLFLKSIGHYIHLWSHWAHLFTQNRDKFILRPYMVPHWSKAYPKRFNYSLQLCPDICTPYINRLSLPLNMRVCTRGHFLTSFAKKYKILQKSTNSKSCSDSDDIPKDSTSAYIPSIVSTLNIAYLFR